MILSDSLRILLAAWWGPLCLCSSTPCEEYSSNEVHQTIAVLGCLWLSLLENLEKIKIWTKLRENSWSLWWKGFRKLLLQSEMNIVLWFDLPTTTILLSILWCPCRGCTRSLACCVPVLAHVTYTLSCYFKYNPFDVKQQGCKKATPSWCMCCRLCSAAGAYLLCHKFYDVLAFATGDLTHSWALWRGQSRAPGHL